MSSDTADIIIIGAGPTGLTLANLLGEAGVKTILIEQNLSTVAEPRAVSIDDESMRTMQALGLANEIDAIVARGYGSRYLAPNGKCFATVDPVTREYGFDKRNAFQQPQFEGLLRNGLARFPSVDARFGCEMERFEQDESGVEVTVKSKKSGTKTVRARFMVACDGGRSPTRKALDIPLEGSTFREQWLIVDLVKTENRFRHTEVYCDPSLPCISLPGPDGIRRYEFMLDQQLDEKEATEETFVRDLLARVGPDRNAELRRVQVYTFHGRIARDWRNGRIFLAGDAAHLTPPFAGQGMNSGLRDAHNLGWKLIQALKTSNHDELLDSYQIERSPHAWNMIELALTMGRVMMPTSPLQGALVRTGFRILSLYPPIRDYFAQMRYKPKPRFLEGLQTLDGRSAKTTMVGRLFPQPEVEDVKRRRFLLDTIIGNQPALLIFSETPDQFIDKKTLTSYAAKHIPVIGITPEWMNPVAASFPIVRDVSRFLSAKGFASYREHAFLLRPDHYVAATAPLGRLSELDGMRQKLTTE
ncbi:MAG: bifunctional 3-(3-hydroxy-phenyl)propionate/3-hydroxycinnamic acid hydroxylase [Rhizobiaceae bacterium]|nr:bifunctional 3-(3-hydroxy-phenyl)propionate/3-hydroxycinnamic acid hydroxylase [Rhizobiaceae bacterium]